VVGNLADDQEEVIRIAGLLRGTESAAQCVSVSCSLGPFLLLLRHPILTFDLQYGLSSVAVMAAVGSVYLNFALWAVAIPSAWYIISQIGLFGDKKLERETRALRDSSDNE
jgi:hypothetical protein